MTLTEAVQRGQRASEYQKLRRENPNVPAYRVLKFMDNSGHESSLKQYTCSHRWSSGYYDDGEYDRECATYCLNCGLSGDI